MSAIFTRSPSLLSPDQRELLTSVSDALELSPECRTVACRRAGRCRGFEPHGSANCLVTLVDTVGACARAARVLLPGGDEPEEPSLADQVNEQIHRVHKRMAELLENEVEKMLGGGEEREGRENKLI